MKKAFYVQLDSKGRIVIPNKLRRDLKLDAGIQMELTPDYESGSITMRENQVLLRPSNQRYLKQLAISIGRDILLCNGEHVLLSSENPREFAYRKPTKQLADLILASQTYIAADTPLLPIEDCNRTAALVQPVTLGGKAGAVVILDDESNTPISKRDMELAQYTSLLVT